MKTKLIILGIVAIVLGGLGYFSPQIFNQSDWKTYVNEEYGFQLSLPDSWEGVEIEEDGSFITFYLPTTGEGWAGEWERAPILDLIITPRSIATGNEINFGYGSLPIGRNSDYVYSYLVPQDHPDDLSLAIQDRDGVISSFKPLK
jgi:hypothetical protein